MKTSHANSRPRISVAVAVHNEEPNLPELLRRLRHVLDAIPGDHEMVFVDDGSRDQSLDLLEAAAADDPRVVVVSLSRNFGHQAALTAALDYVTGDVVVVMDGDLQDTPETIHRFVEHYLQGFDVVYAVRIKRKEGWLLKACYRLFYRLIALMADIQLPEGAGDFALLSRRVVEQLRAAPERHRYLRGLRTWVGFRQMGISVERDARFAGDSKYNLRRLFRLACDGIFSFSLVPLRMATWMGALAILLSTLYAVFSIYVRLFQNESPQGFTTLIVAIVFLSGVQLVSLGIIGEYLGRVYSEVKQRPTYIVDRLVRRQSLAAKPERSDIDLVLTPH